MKSIKYLLMFSIAIMFSLASCTKENSVVEVIDPTPTTPTQTTSNPLVGRSVTTDEGLDMGCFTITYPFSLSVNGTDVPVNSEEDFINAITPDTTFNDSCYIDFVYPLDITYNEDGTMETINDGEALGEAFASCVPDGGWATPGFPAFLITDLNSCYELVYPVSLVDYEGNDYSAADEDEFIELVAQYPDLSFVFPLSLTSIETQEVSTATNDDELFGLLMLCQDSWNPTDTTINPGCDGMFFGCYEIGYPTNYTNGDGDVVTVNNDDELAEAFLNGGFYGFVVPMTLITMDGTVIVVNTDAELEAALAVCDDNTPSGGDPELEIIWTMSQFSLDCFDIVYPVSVTPDTGTTVITLDDENALIEELGNDVYVDIVYPLTILDVSAVENVILDSFEDFIAFTSNCQ